MVFTVVARICGRTQALHSASNSFARIPQKPTSQTKPISLPIPTKKTIYFSRPDPEYSPPRQPSGRFRTMAAGLLHRFLVLLNKGNLNLKESSKAIVGSLLHRSEEHTSELQ